MADSPEPVDTAVNAEASEKDQASMPDSPWNEMLEKDAWNLDLWKQLQTEVERKKDPALLAQFYERLLWQFPTAAKQWISYIELEISQANYAKVNELFPRCLLTCMSIDLWRVYLGYIRRLHSDSATHEVDHGRRTVSQAFEYALQHVGLDFQSTKIWLDYLEFVKQWPEIDPYDLGVKTDTLRKIYHRAISIPMFNIECIWRDYDAYENDTNRMTAKKMIGEKSSIYMTARSAVRDLQSFQDVIVIDTLPSPPSWSESQMKNLRYWRKWIEWEKSNPLNIVDQNTLNARIMYAFRKAMATLRFYPEIWLDAAIFQSQLESKENSEEAIKMLEQGIEIIPDSLLLTFYAAEIDEKAKNADSVKQRFEKLINELQKNMDILQPVIDELKAEMQERERKEHAKKLSSKIASSNSNQVAEESDGAEDAVNEETESRDDDKAEKLEQLIKKMEQLEHLANSAWIQYMKTSRRSEGMKSARQIFSRARKTSYCSCHVFIASATMEYHCNKDKQVAFKIYEVGLKTFGKDHIFVEAYLDFLINTTDDANIRSLFERSIATINPEDAQNLWTKYMNYENEFGDLDAVLSLEKRFAEAYRNGNIESSIVSERYVYSNLTDVVEKELGKQRNQPVPEISSAISPTMTKATAKHLSAIVVLPTTKEEEFLFDVKKKALYTVGKNKFPRMELSGLNIATPDPGLAKEIEQKRKERFSKDKRKREPSPTPSDRPQHAYQPSPPTQSQPRTSDHPPHFQPLHPALVNFFNQLPPPHVYNGPLLNIDLILDIIARTEFTPPPGFQPYPMQALPLMNQSDSSRGGKRRK